MQKLNFFARNLLQTKKTIMSDYTYLNFDFFTSI